MHRTQDFNFWGDEVYNYSALRFLFLAILFLCLSDGFYSQVIVIPALEGFKLFNRLISFVVNKGGIILLQDLALQDLHAYRKRKLLEDLDIIDIVKEIG